jgi:hypothetical protein
MRALSEIHGAGLCWMQPKTFVRWFELRTRDAEVVAALRFEQTLGTLATAESAEGRWTFKRVGFLNVRVTVREVGSQTNLAVYEPKLWGDGVLRFPDGRTYEWKAMNFWGTQWCFADAQGQVVFAFKPERDRPKLSELFKTQADVEVGPAGQGLAELALLVLLGWYLVILQQDDAAAAAAAAAAS